MKYYSIHRPVGPGTYPKFPDNKVLEIVNFDYMETVAYIGRKAWGYIVYEKPIDKKSAMSYELMCKEDVEDEE